MADPLVASYRRRFHPKEDKVQTHEFQNGDDYQLLTRLILADMHVSKISPVCW